MYTSSLRHIHNPVLLSQDRNYTCFYLPRLSGLSVWPLTNSNVFDFYFLIWSLSRLLCCVGSGSNVAAALGYGYTGAITDTTQQTNICLSIHCRNVWLHLNRQPFYPLQQHSNPMRTATSIWPDCRGR